MTYVVAGAGEAGVQVALALRANGYAGRLVMLGDESHMPYTRPPLSKAVLTAVEPVVPVIVQDRIFGEKKIEMRLGVRVDHIDLGAKRLECSDGSSLEYTRLAIATGSRARPLHVAGSESVPVHYVRSYDEALVLKSALSQGNRLVLIGGGYIGLEIAASARQLGCSVTVLEMADRIMARVVGPEVSDFLQELHSTRGVQIRTRSKVSEIRRTGDSFEVVLDGGQRIAADVIAAGVGAIPRTNLAAEAGLAIDDGIVVDEFGRTSDPDVFACGDVANHPNRLLGRRLRLESWQNAQQQGAACGTAMAGNPRPYAMVPWFWSDQYDVNVQMIGAPIAWDRTVVRGNPRDGTFTVIYLADGVVVGGNAINRPKDIAPIRSAIEKRVAPPPEGLGDPAVPLKQVFKEAMRRIEDVA